MPGIDDWYSQVAKMGYEQFSRALEREFEKKKLYEERDIEFAKQKLKDYNAYKKEERDAFIEAYKKDEFMVRGTPENKGQPFIQAIPGRPATAGVPSPISGQPGVSPAMIGAIPGQEYIPPSPATPDRRFNIEEVMQGVRSGGEILPKDSYIRTRTIPLTENQKNLNEFRKWIMDFKTKSEKEKVPPIITTLLSVAKANQVQAARYADKGDIANEKLWTSKAEGFLKQVRPLIKKRYGVDVPDFILQELETYGPFGWFGGGQDVVPDSEAETEIIVRDIATGELGTIPISEFDPKLYKKVD